MKKAKIGIIGLAVMGANLARNIADKGFPTVVCNRTTEKMEKFIEEYGNDNLFGKEDLKEFIQSIESPRKIIIMVKAGDPVEAIINQLLPELDEGDTIIDCGNSNYHDTIRRNQDLSEKKINFVGCGVSGGEEGALHGPSLMPGGSESSWENMKEIWQAISAKDFAGAPCVTHIGEDGAGHYVKMVHNGIEYGVMQMIAEAYDLMKRVYGLDPIQIANVFESFGQGRLESYLFDIVVPVLKKREEQSDEFLIDKILDKAGQKGTGKWTAIDALDRGVGLSTISESVMARIISSFKESRVALAPKYNKPNPDTSIIKDVFVEKLENALYAGMLVIYAQGFELIKTAAEENNWQVNLSEISRIWQGGCIIRAKILKFLTDTYKSSTLENPNLLELEEIEASINEALPDWREIVIQSIRSGIPTPALTTSLQYLEASTSDRLPANLLQGLRDFFGAHTYERIDKEGVFHTEWIE